MLQRALTGKGRRVRSVVRLVFTGVAGLLLLLAFSPGANAQDPYKHSVGLKPSSGDPGSPFTISWNFYPCASGTLSFTWDGAALASGNCCAPGHTVTLTSDGDTVGHAVADTTGAFVSPVEFTRIEAGKHTVVADCGVRLTGAVEQVVTSSSGGHTGTLVVLVFFILAGITAVRFR